jgi:hypothetical protein
MYRELEEQRLCTGADKFVFDREHQCLCLNVKTEIIQVVCCFLKSHFTDSIG